ncbi:hypothetical protein V3C99_015544 [Haemonchus contortus]
MLTITPRTLVLCPSSTRDPLRGHHDNCAKQIDDFPKVMRSGGIEPPSNAWKASMLTITPRTLVLCPSSTRDPLHGHHDNCAKQIDDFPKVMRSGGIEPPSNAWKASMLTITPRTLVLCPSSTRDPLRGHHDNCAKQIDDFPKVMRSGGIEPPSNAWKASMLTITPRTLVLCPSSTRDPLRGHHDNCAKQIDDFPKVMRSGGIEPPSNAWKASMLTITPRTLVLCPSSTRDPLRGHHDNCAKQIDDFPKVMRSGGIEPPSNAWKASMLTITPRTLVLCPSSTRDPLRGHHDNCAKQIDDFPKVMRSGGIEPPSNAWKASMLTITPRTLVLCPSSTRDPLRGHHDNCAKQIDDFPKVMRSGGIEPPSNAWKASMLTITPRTLVLCPSSTRDPLRGHHDNCAKQIDDFPKVMRSGGIEPPSNAWKASMLTITPRTLVLCPSSTRDPLRGHHDNCAKQIDDFPKVMRSGGIEPPSNAWKASMLTITPRTLVLCPSSTRDPLRGHHDNCAKQIDDFPKVMRSGGIEPPSNAWKASMLTITPRTLVLCPSSTRDPLHGHHDNCAKQIDDFPKVMRSGGIEPPSNAWKASMLTITPRTLVLCPSSTRDPLRGHHDNCAKQIDDFPKVMRSGGIEPPSNAWKASMLTITPRTLVLCPSSTRDPLRGHHDNCAKQIDDFPKVMRSGGIEPPSNAWKASMLTITPRTLVLCPSSTRDPLRGHHDNCAKQIDDFPKVMRSGGIEPPSNAWKASMLTITPRTLVLCPSSTRDPLHGHHDNCAKQIDDFPKVMRSGGIEPPSNAWKASMLTITPRTLVLCPSSTRDPLHGHHDNFAKQIDDFPKVMRSGGIEPPSNAWKASMLTITPRTLVLCPSSTRDPLHGHHDNCAKQIDDFPKVMRSGGIEPPSNAWKASMLTITPRTLVLCPSSTRDPLRGHHDNCAKQIDDFPKVMRSGGIEPPSNAWKASMLTITPRTLVLCPSSTRDPLRGHHDNCAKQIDDFPKVMRSGGIEPPSNAWKASMLTITPRTLVLCPSSTRDPLHGHHDNCAKQIDDFPKVMRSGGIEPPSNAWKASMLTITPRTLVLCPSSTRDPLHGHHDKLRKTDRRFPKSDAFGGNRTPVECLEGIHANHYTTNACVMSLINPRSVTWTS